MRSRCPRGRCPAHWTPFPATCPLRAALDTIDVLRLAAAAFQANRSPEPKAEASSRSYQARQRSQNRLHAYLGVGVFTLYMGASSRDIRLTGSYTVTE